LIVQACFFSPLLEPLLDGRTKLGGNAGFVKSHPMHWETGLLSPSRHPPHVSPEAGLVGPEGVVAAPPPPSVMNWWPSHSLKLIGLPPARP
jgi:hypothetical protein